MRFLRGAVVSAVLTLLLVVPSAAAHATPPSGVSGVILSTKTWHGHDYVLREITIQPGGETGWHYHDGPVYAYVDSGTLTRYDSACRREVFPAGHGLGEPSGPRHVHVTRNLGTVPVVFHALYVLPTGSPLSQDAPDPGC